MHIRISRLFILLSALSSAALADKPPYPGIWGIWGSPPSTEGRPWYKGHVVTVQWREIEPADNQFDWTPLDEPLKDAASKGLYVMAMVYTGDRTPMWMYEKGVPMYKTTFRGGTQYPFYLDEGFQKYFRRMIERTAAHLDKDLPPDVRAKVIAVQCPVGASGDPHPYKSADPEGQLGHEGGFGSGRFHISREAWMDYQKKMFRFYYDTYKRTSPRIHTLFNTIYDKELHDWAMANLDGLWIKTNRIGDRYQYNGESRENSYLTWLPPQIRTFQRGKAVRARSEMDLNNQGWFKEAPLWNMYWTQLWGLHCGQDMHNQVESDLLKKEYYPAFQFYSDYAGYKDPRDSHGAWCALRDSLDYADAKRFPEDKYGPAGKAGRARYEAILKAYAQYGAKQSATGFGSATNWRGMDDVGYNIHRGNFEMYLSQYDPDGTSQGLWRVGPLDQQYGRFARRFDHASGKDAMFFNIDDGFFFGKPLKGAYEVKVRVVYFDGGTGRWALKYDAVKDPNKIALSIKKTNSGRWKEATVTLHDANFGNRCPHGTDLVLVNEDAEDDTFHMIEITRSTGDRKKFWGDE